MNKTKKLDKYNNSNRVINNSSGYECLFERIFYLMSKCHKQNIASGMSFMYRHQKSTQRNALIKLERVI